MPLSASDARIFSSHFGHPAIDAAFSDEAYVRRMLEVEAALASVLGRLEIIPRAAAQHIAQACAELEPDLDPLRAGVESSGVPVIALVGLLRTAVGEPDSRYVHWGATSQDILDTGRALQIREALEVISAELDLAIDGLAALTRRHRDLVMPGRTHSQQALPITFGYKVATWLAPLLRHRRRLRELRPRVEALQLGGAVGTLAAYRDRGPAAYEALAAELGLAAPETPWHVQRDGPAELAGWLSLVSGGLGKMGQDLILLAQTEVGEVREAQDPSRGGSSTMPQKHNPVLSEVLVAASRVNPSLLAAMHGALVQEHERGTHGLQVEWIVLPQMLGLTASSLAKAATISRELALDEARVRANLAASKGTLLAEAVRLALLDSLPADQAEALLKQASEVAVREDRPLIEVVHSLTDAELDWEALADQANYLGSAQWFIDRVLAGV
jgi:3-carboxy-cis,cis-muconate cycloisomerase